MVPHAKRIPAEEPTRAEYRLLLSGHIRERDHRRTTLLALETTRLFASFQYDLSVRESLTPGHLHIKILGLRAPSLNLPTSGPARFVKEYEELKGKQTVTIEAMDGTKNSFSIHFGSMMRVTSKPKNAFVELVVEP